MSKLGDILRKSTRPFCTAVVVAAGSSTRMGEDKLMLEIGGVPVLAHTLKAFDASEWVDEVIVVTQEEKLDAVADLCRKHGILKCNKAIIGGKERTQSALNGVMAANSKAKIIAIHDGARPFVTEKVIAEAVRAAQTDKAAAPTIPVKDTIRMVTDGVVTVLPRADLHAMQTPQCFMADMIKGALTKAVKEGVTYTDDCAAVEAMGVRVKLTEGDEDNIKITTPADLPIAEAILAKKG